jgi:hypothetical protein
MDVPRNPWREPRLEEYSRVTNPERFQPLHTHALDLIARLEASYDIRRSEDFELVPGIMQPYDHARPPVTLTPVLPEAAPIAIAFTTFPGVSVRFGRWHAQSFPSCGCDACAEDATGEAERLDAIIAKVVAGKLFEELRIPFFGNARLVHGFRDSRPSEAPAEGGWTTISRTVARALAARGPRRIQWEPWPLLDRHGRDGAPAF